LLLTIMAAFFIFSPFDMHVIGVIILIIVSRFLLQEGLIY
jgi:hypothetical protein